MMNEFTIGDIKAAVAIEEQVESLLDSHRRWGSYMHQDDLQIAQTSTKYRLEALRAIRDTFNG